MNGTFDYTGFMELIRRASHSKYKAVYMHGRMLMNCYNLDEDSDVGMHYVLHIPDTDQYRSDFYDLDIIFDIPSIMEKLSPMKKEHEIRRKTLKLKPKQASIVGRYELFKGYLLFSADFMLEEEVWRTAEIKIPYPVDTNHPLIANIETTYNLMLERVDSSVDPVIINGLTQEIREKTLENVRVFYYPVKIGGEKIPLPFLKSSFHTLTKFEQFDISVQKTTIPHIYLVSHTFSSKGLTDQYIMYVEDFR